MIHMPNSVHIDAVRNNFFETNLMKMFSFLKDIIYEVKVDMAYIANIYIKKNIKRINCYMCIV